MMINPQIYNDTVLYRDTSGDYTPLRTFLFFHVLN